VEQKRYTEERDGSVSKSHAIWYLDPKILSLEEGEGLFAQTTLSNGVVIFSERLSCQKGQEKSQIERPSGSLG
jgi:hypothetical protein